MRVRVVSIILVLLLYVTRTICDPDPPVARVVSLYARADRLFRLANATPATDSTALTTFSEVIRLTANLPNFAEKDTLLSLSLLKKGILLDAYAHYPQAIEAYRQTLNVHHKEDSIRFIAQTYAGAAYYNLNNFDSADYFLQNAERTPPAARNWDGEFRLYNSLGVLYYDNGNYQQAINYFDHALRLVESKQPLDKISAVNIRTNIATSFYRLGQYEEALNIYKKILGYKLATNFIYLNMGRTYAALGAYAEAMASYHRVDAAAVPAVWNEMGLTQWSLHHSDSAVAFLDRLVQVKQVNPLDLGINQLYRADILMDRQQYEQALKALQQAIVTFSRGNSDNFTGVFAYFRLFDALLKKAQVLGFIAKRDPSEKGLKASLDAYDAALELLRYIEKSYDTDEAKLFLKKKSADAYDGALSVCLQLHQLRPSEGYLEKAYLISEKSKATIIFANLQENAFYSGSSNASKQVLGELRNVKYHIAKLNVALEAGGDSASMNALAREKADYGMKLAGLQKQLERDNAYYKLKYEDEGPDLKTIRQQLTGDQVLISYYAAANELLTFMVTKEAITYHKDDSIAQVRRDVESWVNMLKSTENGRRFKPGAVGDRLYNHLVQPIKLNTHQNSEWIIVPDGFLYYLPFESLPSGENFLLQDVTISYRLSNRLLKSIESPAGNADILAFAPFAHDETKDFPRLPASGDEIAGLKATTYIDSAATKQNFERAANTHQVVHLATHATSGAFIVFHDDRLYLEELYGLNLSNVRLVVISACETGQGELAGKEGVMSLSRAFAYAGCQSTINSLWRADDKATSFIVKRLYVYLKKGYTKSHALRQAKLDYLSSDDVLDKSPAYWAHLVLMGDDAPLYSSNHWIMGVVIVVSALVVAGYLFSLYWTRRRSVKDIFRTLS